MEDLIVDDVISDGRIRAILHVYARGKITWVERQAANKRVILYYHVVDRSVSSIGTPMRIHDIISDGDITANFQHETVSIGVRSFINRQNDKVFLEQYIGCGPMILTIIKRLKGVYMGGVAHISRIIIGYIMNVVSPEYMP